MDDENKRIRKKTRKPKKSQIKQWVEIIFIKGKRKKYNEHYQTVHSPPLSPIHPNTPPPTPTHPHPPKIFPHPPPTTQNNTPQKIMLIHPYLLPPIPTHQK